MKAEIISLHDGFPLDVAQRDSLPPKAVVRFEAVTVSCQRKWDTWGPRVKRELKGLRGRNESRSPGLIPEEDRWVRNPATHN